MTGIQIDTSKSLNHAQRLRIAEQADYCVKWLKVQGHEVLLIEKGPRITVRTCQLCDQLEGAVAGYSRALQGEQRYKMVTRFGCEVRWAVDGGMQ